MEYLSREKERERESMDSPLLEKKKCKIPYFILPVTHGLCIGLGIFIGLKINSLNDGSL